MSNGAFRQVDTRGFWAYAAARPENPGWLFLGDSVTMGLGVVGDSTFAGILAATQDSLDVLNASLPGHASNDYATILGALIGNAEISRITVFWCLNDVMAGLPIATLPSGVRVLDNRLMAFVRRHVYTYAWLKATLSDRPKQYYLHDKELHARDQGYLDTAVSHLVSVEQLADAHDIPLQVVLLPYEYSLRTGDMLPHTVMKAELEQMGVPVFDVAQALKDTTDPDRLYLYGDGIYFSNYGHQRVAALLEDYFTAP